MVKSVSEDIINHRAKMYGRSAGSVMDPGDGRTPSRAPSIVGPYSRTISHEFQHSSLPTAAIVASSLAVRRRPSFTYIVGVTIRV
jgi:hypothetical protein